MNLHRVECIVNSGEGVEISKGNQSEKNALENISTYPFELVYDSLGA